MITQKKNKFKLLKEKKKECDVYFRQAWKKSW